MVNSPKKLLEEIAVIAATGYITDHTRFALDKFYNKSVMAPTKKVTKFIGPINRPIKVENKFFDVALTNSALNLPAAAAIVALNVPTLGNESYNRVGRKMFLKRLHITGYIQNNATCLQDLGRILIIYDKQPNAALPAVSAILADCNAAAVTNASSHRNVSNLDRFKFLKDYQFQIPACTNTAGVLTNGPVLMDPIRNTFNISWSIKLRGLETQFNTANGGTIADIATGSILLVPLANAVSGAFTLLWSSRLVFTD